MVPARAAQLHASRNPTGGGEPSDSSRAQGRQLGDVADINQTFIISPVIRTAAHGVFPVG